VLPHLLLASSLLSPVHATAENTRAHVVAMGAFEPAPVLLTHPRLSLSMGHEHSPSNAVVATVSALSAVAGSSLTIAGTFIDFRFALLHPFVTTAAGAIPVSLMTDGRAGYVTLGAGVGYAAGAALIGLPTMLAVAIGASGEPIVSAVIITSFAVVPALTAAAGAVFAAHIDEANQRRVSHLTWTPTVDVRRGDLGLALSGQF